MEKFDYSRGNKFSTYASWAIMKNFARTIPSEFKHKDRFRTKLASQHWPEEILRAQVLGCTRVRPDATQPNEEIGL